MRKLLLTPLLFAPSLALASGGIDTGDTAIVLIGAGLVLLMTPGLAFFYGGLVRAKNVVHTMNMSIACMAIAGVVWALVGYSLSFSPGAGPLDAVIGGFAWLGLRDVGASPEPSLAATIPHTAFMLFQGMFAVITPALISGAIVERARIKAWLLFVALWSVFVYAPVAHWVWGGGWLAGLGALDFAGGTVVHVNAGVAAVVAATVLGPRKDYGRQALLPHNVPFVLLGAALLWFGWFGFNAGSALAANETAVLAFANTLLAPGATLVVWMLLDVARTRKITAVGAATGIVVGLVAITPAAGFVSPRSALLIGALAAAPSYFAIVWRTRTRLDDSLDVAAAHGLGGLVGALLTGVFASAAFGGTDGLLHGNPGQVGIQAAGVLAVIAYSGVVSFGLLKAISLVTSLRPARLAEGAGLDVAEHGEEAYAHGEGALLIQPEEDRP